MKTFILLNGEITSRTNKSERLKQLFTQDLVYAITNGRVKTLKSVLYPYHIKPLTNNTELINITCRLGHGISYFLLEELSTETAYQRLEAVEEGSVCLPEDCKTGTFTTEVDDNIVITLIYLIRYKVFLVTGICSVILQVT